MKCFGVGLVGLLFILLTATCSLPDLGSRPEVPNDRPGNHWRLPAEFESQNALIVSWQEEAELYTETYVELVRAAEARVPIIVLVSNERERELALGTLAQHGVSTRLLRFVELPLDTIWVRDYGPILVKSTRNRSALVDTEYSEFDRPKDDRVPRELGGVMGLPVMGTPIILEGGNLLTNGGDVAIASTIVFDDNESKGYSHARVRQILRGISGARQIVMLEPLQGEPTGHVDLFATFTSPCTVVVGSYSPQMDPINAEILDRNADRLSRIVTDEGTLHVVRIPMPPNDDEVWRSYTNVVYLNGTLLMPQYPGVDPVGEAVARTTYQELLPGWRVTGIDCTQIIAQGGALHCITVNLPTRPTLPSVRTPGREIPSLVRFRSQRGSIRFVPSLVH